MKKNMLGKAILNPVNMFDLLGIELPNENCPYISIIDETLSGVFDKMFIYEQFKNDVDKIISRHKRKLKDFSSYVLMMENAKDDIMVLHDKICDYVFYSEALTQMVLSELENIELDSSTIYLELRKTLKLNTKDEKYLLRYVRLFEEITENILNKIDLLNNGGEGESASTVAVLEEEESEEVNRMPKMIEFKPDDNGKLAITFTEKDTLHVYDKKKEDMKQLRKEVNEFDEQHGLDLKHPEEIIDNSYAYEEKIHTYRVILTKLVCLLNDADIDKYLIQQTIFGEELRKIKINKKFRKKSELFDGIAHNPKDFGFKSRFLTYLINFIIENLEKIPNACYKVNKDGEFIEYEAKNEYLDTVMEYIADLIINMLEGNDYSTELLFINELIIILDKTKKKAIKKINKIYEQTELLYDHMRRLKSSQAVTVDSILKLSYMISVNDYGKVKNVADITIEFKKRDSDAVKMVIEQLGESIIDAREDETDVNELYRIFLLADPLLLSRWKDVNEDEGLLVGLTTLKYFEFVIKNKKVSRFITAMTEKWL